MARVGGGRLPSEPEEISEATAEEKRSWQATHQCTAFQCLQLHWSKVPKEFVLPHTSLCMQVAGPHAKTTSPHLFDGCVTVQAYCRLQATISEESSTF